jgi:Thermostable hemolysin
MKHGTACRYGSRESWVRVGGESGAKPSFTCAFSSPRQSKIQHVQYRTENDQARSDEHSDQALGTGKLRLKLTCTGDDLRSSIETFIVSRYEQAFGSAIVVNYPLLISLHETSGTIVAAVGLRWANENDLFLEQYLARNVETVLSSHFCRPIERRDIVELGSLAAVCAGATPYLIGAVAAYMAKQKFNFALVTSTSQLRRIFSLFDFELSSLGPAQRDALRDQSSDWGTYYEHTPEVLVGSVQQCLDSVRRCPALAGNTTRSRILQGLFNQVRALA